MKKDLLMVVLFALLLAGIAFAAPKSASDYYSDAAFQYIENRLPTAEITCNEGLQNYPNDQKLQMLLDRIKEAKDEQKNENKKNDPKNDQNQNQDQNKDNQDKDQNQQNQDQQNQDQNSGESSSSADNQENQDQQNGGGQSSSSEAGSSDSNGGADQQPQPEQPQDQSSDSQGNNDQQPDETPAMLSPEEASQLLKDFDEQNGERKPWKPIRGQKRPERDW